jgi:phosphodiesterase/alkaline phosphatase D-like protein
MNKVLVTLAITVLSGALFIPGRTSAQLISPAQKTAHVRITKGPSLELAKDTWVIITWTSNNPGGSDEHFGLVRFGTDPKDLRQTAKSHIRLNQNHSYTVFRVRVEGLQPHTTYYYKVDSMDSQAKDDGVTSALRTFMTK